MSTTLSDQIARRTESLRVARLLRDGPHYANGDAKTRRLIDENWNAALDAAATLVAEYEVAQRDGVSRTYFSDPAMNAAAKADEQRIAEIEAGWNTGRWSAAESREVKALQRDIEDRVAFKLDDTAKSKALAEWLALTPAQKAGHPLGRDAFVAGRSLTITNDGEGVRTYSADGRRE